MVILVSLSEQTMGSEFESRDVVFTQHALPPLVSLQVRHNLLLLGLGV
ncbi:unnamed protein product [Amoebophrya sp. A25]|nr:unnamed protein product [Amoebophrya sp. A25]|eukprot:GSA25T00027053001.1